MISEQAQKVITCILPMGRGMALLNRLVKEKGLTAVDIHHARGLGRITPLRHRGIGEMAEKEILTVSVPAAEADDLFEFIYTTAEVNRPHGGLIFMQKLHTATHFTLPELPEETA
ncbi:hypothetical protein [Rhabdochromatium marinum]|uniref:hypothetical protein n=1 Tax=Rhabdochromatium marinum TaxID=48729 RepID=UPI0019073950|nr:hypothetical protein [Rhabdochromatium marinum]MBK1648792.1 hypothetical protein [Rhabdochromatium marinum]